MMIASQTTWILLAGLPATGKSSLARALSARLERCTLLDKDRVRNALFPGDMTDYTPAQDALCVRAMIDAADYMTTRDLAGYIVLDGRTFSRSAQIDEVVSAAESAGARWRIVLLISSDEVAEARLSTPDPAHPAKNRDCALYRRIKAQFEPIVRDHIVLDTSWGIDPVIANALHWISA